MRKTVLGVLFLAFFLMSGRASAVPPCPASQPAYVSSATQILCVETAAGTSQGQVTVLLTDASSNFEDVAFGPDGLLYFTDSKGARVFRFDPKSAAAAATLVALIPSGTPAGLSFSSSSGASNGDLYVNSSTGVWRIAGIASSVSPVSPPVTPTQAITFSSSITAQGSAFDLLGAGETETQIIVDQTHNQILQSPFPFTSSKVLAQVSSLGEGIFANFCGDALVASGTSIQRLSFSFDNQGNLVVTPSTYVNFGKSNPVQYFEVAADNTVIAATFANGAGGLVWSVAPVKDSTGLPSCSATPTVTPLASLKALQRKNPPDLLSDVANGVALGPTSVTITRNFGPGNPGQTYNFGFHRLIVTYQQVLQSFSQSFTAVRSRPADVSFSSTFQPNTVPTFYAPLGGFAVQYVTPEANAPVNCVQNPGDYQFGPCPPGSAPIEIKLVFSTQDTLAEPGMAHATGDALLTAPQTPVTYADDVTHDVWLADQTNAGTGSIWRSTYVAHNQALAQNLAFALKSPTSSCGATTTPTCNPQFNIGQNVAFGFRLSPSTNLSAAARLSIAKVHVAVDGTIQIDQTINVSSKNSVNVDNFFKFSTSLNQYTYNWDSSGAAGAGPGLYQATIFSDSFTPQVVYMTMK